MESDNCSPGSQDPQPRAPSHPHLRLMQGIHTIQTTIREAEEGKTPGLTIWSFTVWWNLKHLQLRVTVNPTQTGLTESMNLPAHTARTLGEVWLQAHLAPGAWMSFSISLLCFLLSRLHSRAHFPLRVKGRALSAGSTGSQLHRSKASRKAKPLFPGVPAKVLELSLFRADRITCPSLNRALWPCGPEALLL